MSQIASDQLEEIKTLLSSSINSSKSWAYSTLLHLQEQSTEDHFSIQILAANSRKLLSHAVADIANDDEEIASQALKCLGFMIYHPTIVDSLSVDDGSLVIASLAKLIINTQIKSICNLGVWCISIQQLNASYLAADFHSLLRAVVHALDNPNGSLSTTFEAMQAVMKLASQVSEKMRDSSNIWAPPIYRRLLSLDKREKDMSERCLLKMKSIMFPPLLTLSKTIIVDMKRKLLTGMKELLDLGRKVQSVQAWGWFIRLLGSHAMKDRHLVNDMLKVLEKTFTDHDPQVQIASLVAWEGLIDVFIHPPVLTHERKSAVENNIQQAGISKGSNSEFLPSGFLKSLKLIMTPLIGIMLSKCDIPVYSSCFNTWCYLLHKLDTSVNHPSVMKVVLEPIFEAVFRIGPDGMNLWLWHQSIDLIEDFILAKHIDVNYDLNSQLDISPSSRTSKLGLPISGKCVRNHYPIKWLPWDLSQMESHMKVIGMLINQASVAIVTNESRSAAFDAAHRIFKSVLRGVQLELKSSTTKYDDIILCLKTVFRFMKRICENLNSENSDHNDLHCSYLQFIEVVTEELDPSLLGSPLYKVALDLKYIDCLQSVNHGRHAELFGIGYFTHMEMVSPVIYLIVLYFSVVAQLTLKAPKTELLLQGMNKYFKFVLSSYDPREIVPAIISLLYKNVGFRCLKIWVVITKCLHDCVDSVKDFSLLTESDCTGYFSMCHFLSYPFVVCSSPQKELSLARISCSSEESPASPQSKLDLQPAIEVWKSLYVSVTRQLKCSNMNRFHEDMSSMLNGCIDSLLESDSEHDMGCKDLEFDSLSFLGNVLICVLEQTMTSEASVGESKMQSDAEHNTTGDIKNRLEFASRFMKLSWTKLGTEPSPTDLTSRVFSALAHFVSWLHFKQDILMFLKTISSPLLQWLSCAQVEDQSANNQLHLLWAETVNCLRRSKPPIIFDSAFLNLQAPLLEKTLDHQNPSISEPTISFWNSTYGEQTKLDYPQSLLAVLDKLSRNGKIRLCKRHPPSIVKCNSRPENDSAHPSYRVTPILSRSSKRVELVKLDHSEKVLPTTKRKRLELTEHQKEVRRAQQGRTRECSSHGPGIRTYTSVDFSQGNEDSQESESQEIRNPESILEMLRREC